MRDLCHNPSPWWCYSGLSLLLVGLLLIPIGLSHAEDDAPTFQLNLVQQQFLPPAMYGTWNIKATVLKSDAPPWQYLPEASEIWTLGREQDVVTLHNVITNATATVAVDKAEGNTATFHHEASDARQRIKIRETPTITVNGNQLSGINRQQITFYRKGQPRATYYLEIQVEGTRLAGATAAFRHPEEMPDPVLEIAPLQFEDR